MSPFAAEVAACRAAQQPWAALSVRERLKPVRDLRHLLVERADEIFAAIAADIQRPAVEVLATELLPTTAALKYLEQDAVRLLKPRRIAGRFRPTWLLGSRDAVHRRPWGVVGIIGTWNYPVYLNAVPEAGETEFYYQQRKIEPEAGSLLIAPAGFTHTHRGNTPVGGDKYIATSWVLFQRAEVLYGGGLTRPPGRARG